MIQLDSSVPKSQLSQEKRTFGWQEALFIFGLILYLATRFIALDKFPIYFFSDEAIQTVSASKMIENGFRDASGHIPVYFENGGQYNLSLSVWLQILVASFRHSIWLTRGLSALITVIFPLTLGLALRDFFKRKYWWLAPFVVSVLPAWFLHSRTAFETAIGTALYCAFLYFYLRYRMQDRDYLPIFILFGALTFYAYAPLQIVVVLTGFILLFVDFRYHFQDKKIPWLGIVTLVILALPYLIFRLRYPDSLSQHLSILQSYWSGTEPFMTKLGEFFSRYLSGLNPIYWFKPNQAELIRHQMKNMAHVPLLLAPFIGLGLIKTFTKLKDPAWRVVLIALLVAPTGAALVDVAITRNLVTLVPLAFLACLGLDSHLNWLGKTDRKALIPVAIILIVLVASSAWITHTAITIGPIWYQDYGLYGMQWGGKELSAEIKAYQAEHPNAKIIVSPSWANNTDVILGFFLGDPLPIEVNSVKDWSTNQKDLDKSMIFVMSPEEYNQTQSSSKFDNLEVHKTLAWPNGEPGFYFVSMDYSENAEDIFKTEQARKAIPEEATITLFDQEVDVTYSQLDIGKIENLFDGNTNTLIRGLQANPLAIKMTFSEPVSLTGLQALIGIPPTSLFVKVESEEPNVSKTFSAHTYGTEQNSWLSVHFAGSLMVKQLTITVQERTTNPHPHIHIWEIEFLQH